MKIPTKGHRRLTLADLAQIRRMVCDKDKPAAGAQRFHALHVCGECGSKINQRVAEKGAQGKKHDHPRAD